MSSYSAQPKNPILLENVKDFAVIDKAIIESLEQALYRLVIEVEGQQYFVLEDKDKILIRRNILSIQELLMPFTVHQMFLFHHSPYDEMIGQEVSEGSNEMLIPLGNYFRQVERVLH